MDILTIRASMNLGKLISAQISGHLPLTTFRRRVARSELD
jgi:hypothetical protein